MADWRAKRTILNWRWWVILPLVIALLPVVLLDLVLLAFASAGVAAEVTRDMLASLTRHVTKPCFGWARAHLKEQPR